MSILAKAHVYNCIASAAHSEKLVKAEEENSTLDSETYSINTLRTTFRLKVTIWFPFVPLLYCHLRIYKHMLEALSLWETSEASQNHQPHLQGLLRSTFQEMAVFCHVKILTAGVHKLSVS